MKSNLNFNSSFTLRLPIILITALLGVIAIATYFFFINNIEKIMVITDNNLKVNIEDRTGQLAQSIENGLTSVSTNLYLLSNTPAMKGNRITSISILETSKEATNLSSEYGWSDEKGNIKWNTLFNDKKYYDKFMGSKVPFIQYLDKIKSPSEIKPYFTPLIQAKNSTSSIYGIYPIFATVTNNTILDFSHSYTPTNLYEIVKNHTDNEKLSKKELVGTVYASINASKLINLLQDKIPSKDKISMSLLDNEGKIIYSSSKDFMDLVSHNNINKYLGGQYDKANLKSLSQLKVNMIGGQTGNTTIANKNGDKFTLSYSPILLNKQIVFYLLLGIPHTVAAEVNDLSNKNKDFTLISLLIISIIVSVLVLMLQLFNKTVRKEIEKKTSQLNKIISKQQITNEQLQIHDKVQKEFINIAAHELRTPTQSIIGYIELIKIFPESFKKYLDPLTRNAERLHLLTEDILDVTRIESGHLKIHKSEFDLIEKINNVIEDLCVNTSYAPRLKISPIIFIPSTETLVIYADKIRIYQVINNLLKNALKFSEDSAIMIGLATKYNEAENKDYVVMKIKDMGRGINQRIRPRLFEKFSSTSSGGTGLGLYITKNIIKSHNGSIKGYNNNEINPLFNGATFEFTIPIQ